MCQESARLFDVYEQWEEAFSAALAEHCGQHALVAVDQYQQLRDGVEFAAVGLHNAKAAHRIHQIEHGCHPPASIGIGVPGRSSA
jgi:hypothetical protein